MGSTPTILVIDDEAFMRRVVRQTLANLGFVNVVEAESAQAALALFGKNHFDLILSDIYMPGMSGLELLRAIRSGQTQVPRNSRFIVITSFSNTEVLSASIALGVNGFLVKPIRSDLVRKKILKALNETMHLRPAEKYAEISIDTHWASRVDEKRVIDPSGSHQHEQPMAQEEAEPTPESVPVPPPPFWEPDEPLPPGAREVSLLQIAPESVLARDLIAKDGTLLLKKGQKLSQQIINRLHDLRSILRSEWIPVEVDENDEEQNSGT